VQISYVANETENISRFLKEIKGIKYKTADEKQLGGLLFECFEKPAVLDEDFEFNYDFKKGKLSNSKLKTYLECKRKFYYKYVAYIKKFELPKDMPQEWEIGSKIHLALKRLYEKNSYFDNEEVLFKSLENELEALSLESELEKFQISLYKEILKSFVKNEIKRFKSGYKVFCVEKNTTLEYNKLTLEGVIDRCDIKDDKLFVIDYKTGNINIYNKNNYSEANDFQLEFYYLLASGYKEVEDVAFYDLKNAKLVYENFFEQKLQILKKYLDELENITTITAQKCDDIKKCKYCEYNIMCGRE
jgi:RecB family exonuclease